MSVLRKLIAILLTCILFAALAVASVVASIVILGLGIAMMIWVRYQKPERFTSRYQEKRADIIEGEYRVIETTQMVEKNDI